MELSKRLMAVAERVPKHCRGADVGTDHGLLSIYLLKNGICSHVIASDVNEKPLDKARAAGQSCGMGEELEFRLCDGLSGIGEDETDCVIIAGMGGDTIAEILEKCPWAQQGEHTLILQPMSSSDTLRRKLYDLGLKIEEETLVEEQSGVYSVFVVKGRDDTPKQAWEDYISKALAISGCELYGAYLEDVIRRVTRARDGAAVSKKEHDKPRVREFDAVLEGLVKLKGDMK